jgi:serine/threonine protein kinase
VVHRDLKPENVIIRADRTACLVDLGIAKWTKFDLGGERDPDDIEGGLERPPPNADYAPPEALDRQLYDELGDQYAFGVLAYEMLTGSLPTVTSPPLTGRDDVPHVTAAAIDRARSLAREDRWAGMELMLDELVDRVASRAPQGQAPKTSPKTLPKTAPESSPDSSAEPEGGPRAASVAPERPREREGDRGQPRRMAWILGVVVVLLVLAAALVATFR